MSKKADDDWSTETAVAGGEDRISALPDDVLRHLLSFLPSRNSVRTCVLAKRWCTLWKSVPALRIKDDPLDVLELSSCIICGNILSQSLRHLIIDYGIFINDIRCRISAPNLVSLKLHQDSGLAPLLDSMPSLVTASVGESNAYIQKNGEDSFSVVLEGLSSATNLELITPFYQYSIFEMDLKWCPMFSKLKTLLLNGWCLAHNFTGMVYFLQHSPILETLQLDFQKHEEYYSIETYESCNSREQSYNSKDQSLLSKHLKVVKIICGKKVAVIVQRILKILYTHGVPSEQIDIQYECCSSASI